MLVYITRPTAAEIYLGGMRGVQLWLHEPMYRHSSTLLRATGSQYVDTGWTDTAGVGSLRCKGFLKQSKALQLAIWQEIFLSLLPKGLTLDEADAWASQPDNKGSAGGAQMRDRWYRDPRWEALCNTSHKRFLLRVDLASGNVGRIAPRVELKGGTASLEPQVSTINITRTDLIDEALALELVHVVADPWAIPF